MCWPARATTDSRWPVILTNIVSAVTSVNHTLNEEERDKLAEGKEIIRKLSELKYNMGRNAVLQCVGLEGAQERVYLENECSRAALTAGRSLMMEMRTARATTTSWPRPRRRTSGGSR